MNKADGKKHFKLYKSGKKWLTAAIVSTGFLVGGTHIAHADKISQLNRNHVQTSASTPSDATNTDGQSNQEAASSVTSAEQSPASQAPNEAVDVPVAMPVNDATFTINLAVQPKESRAPQSGSQQAVSTSDASKINPASQKAPVSYNGYSWTENNGDYYWQNASGQKLTGWQDINNSWYYLGDNGTAKVNTWYQSPFQNWFYFNDQGQVATGFQTINGRGYHFDESNAWADTGWQKINDNWYYYNPTSAWAEPGWQKINNNWYYFNQDGQAKTGRQQLSWNNQSNWYWFDANNAWMHTGQQTINGGVYSFNGDGSQQIGWQQNGAVYYDPANNGRRVSGEAKINGASYYFDPVTGQKATGFTLIPSQNVIKYFDQSGKLQTSYGKYSINKTTGVVNFAGLVNANGLVTLGNQTFLYNEVTGKFMTGWQTVAGKKLYFVPATGAEATSWTKIDNSWYYFGTTDHQAQTGLSMINGNHYLFAANGAAQTGWQKLNGNWYYFDDANAWAKKGWFQSTAGDWFYFDPVNGWAETGWQKINNKWYYFDDINAWAKKGWFQSGDNWYYFDPVNGWAETGWQVFNGNWYYFDQTNAWALKGWQSLNGTWYYFDPTNVNMYTGSHVINGKTYKFNTSGAWEEDQWAWPFPAVGRGSFAGVQLFGVNPGGEFRMNGFHDGLDFGSYDHPGSQVQAVHSGKVVQIDYAAGLDWYVLVDTGEYLTVYQEAFSSRSNIAVSVGQEINVGDVIGTRTTAHLHLGITRQHDFGIALANSFNNNGTWLNPLDILSNAQ